jgi:zinc transport system substrate-binding protein
MKKFLSLILVLLLLCPLAASAETVVTSFYPIWLMAQNLTEEIDGITVTNLAEPTTGCLHDYTLQNSDMVALSKANVLLINGAGMETFLPVVTGAYPDLPVVDASRGILLLESDDDGESNPHIWLDPQRAVGMAANLAEGLIQYLPEYSRQISDNLAAYRERLLAVDQTIRDQLMQVGDLPEVVIFHEAFPYFADACELPVLLAVDKEPDDDLSTAQLAGILEMVRQSPSLPLIIKSKETDRSVDVLVSETGAPVCELDPITTGPDNPPLDYYETVMIQNLQTLLSFIVI